MTILKMLSGCFIVVITASIPAFAQEEAHPTVNSEEYSNSFDTDVKALLQRNFHGGLDSPSFGAAAAADFKEILNNIKTTWNTLATERGNNKVPYDVILQPGHYKRRSGATGAQGNVVSEQELAAYIVKGVADELNKQGKLKVLVIDADNYTPNLKSKLFLAVHADGSKPACKTAPSLSYHKPSSTLAMHAIGWGLSQALGIDYGKFRKDGFTANAAHYYMYTRVDAPIMKGLLEVGEITCADKEKQLVVSADHIATNVARAINFVLESAIVRTDNK